MSARLSREELVRLLFAADGITPNAPITPPEVQLAAIVRLILADEFRLRDLPEDHADCIALLRRIDALLHKAAAVRPEKPTGFAVKAYLAQRYAGTSRAGGRVLQQLLTDLVARGGKVAA